VNIASDVRGDGPPVLFVQGLGYGRGGWGPAPELLADSFSVITFDNRGFGDSDKPPGPYTTAQLAADAVAVLDAAGIERAHVLGASLGGMTAQELALAAPERVDKLVLCCTTPGGAESAPMPAVTIALMQNGATIEQFVANALAPDAPQSLVAEILAYRSEHPPDPAGWQSLAAAGATHDAYDRLGEIAAPTLVLHGTADNVVAPQNAELLASRIPNARLEWFEGAGHLFQWEQPERFVAVVEEFLQ
jgi:pimeloyl-ACP methyl ester carboxylesterase